MTRTTIGVAFLLLANMPTFSQKLQNRRDHSGDSSLMQIKIEKEPRFFVNIHTGYSFALGSTFRFYPDDVRSISVRQLENEEPVRNVSYKAPTRGLGQGLRFGAGISYIVNDFINVGVDFDYFHSTISKTRDSSYYRLQAGADMNEISYKERLTISYEATLLTFSPNIMLKAISRPDFFIYTKVGPVLTFRPNSLQRETTKGDYRFGWQGFYQDSSTTVERTYDWGIKNPSVGFMGGVGTQIRIAERFRLAAEIQFSHLVFVVRERMLSSYKVDGREMVATLPVAERQLTFEKDLDADESQTDPAKPARTIIQRIPITYVGAQLGLVYRF